MLLHANSYPPTVPSELHLNKIMLLFLIYWTSMEYIYIEISCLNTSLMKNIAVVILLWILIREKNDLWNFLLPHLCVCVCLCVCVSLSLYMIRNLCDLIKFNIENIWVDSKSLFWKKNLKETVNKLIWLTQDLFSLKTLIFPAQCVYFTIKYILVCFWFRGKKKKKKTLWSESKNALCLISLLQGSKPFENPL